jgi:hypothetical protein
MSVISNKILPGRSALDGPLFAIGLREDKPILLTETRLFPIIAAITTIALTFTWYRFNATPSTF